MRCPQCRHTESRVVDSRPAEDGREIRRRRACEECGARFTTYERIEGATPPVLIKKDGRREPYERTKVVDGIRKACQKRPVSTERIERMADLVEADVRQLASGGKEVPASAVGEAVMRLLMVEDEVAYVRFASVYRTFRDASSFTELLRELKGMNAETPRRRGARKPSDGGRSTPSLPLDTEPEE